MMHQRVSRPMPMPMASVKGALGARRSLVVRAAASAPASSSGWLAQERFADWHVLSKELKERQLKTVTPVQAQELAAKFGYLIVDVRPKTDYDAAHPEGAAHGPLFSLMDWDKQKGDIRAVLKFVACTLNGVTPFFQNANFAQDVQAAAERAGARGVILACEAGGTLEVTANFPCGKVSRSLKAAHRILADPDNKLDVKHLEYGVYGWHKAELPFEGDSEYDDSNVGRTPNAAYNGLLTDFKKGEGC